MDKLDQDLNSILKQNKPRKKQGLIILLFLVLLSMFLIPKNTNPPKEKYSPIIRLIEERDNQRFTTCSAVVVSENLAITAHHCISGNYSPSLFSDENKTIHLPFKVHVATQYRDIAFIVGDFRDFKTLQITNKPMEIGKKYLSCGYPYNGNKVCTSLELLGPYYHLASFKGLMYGGMSGGPIYDEDKGLLYGVNHAIHIGFVVGSPVVNILNFLGYEN